MEQALISSNQAMVSLMSVLHALQGFTQQSKTQLANSALLAISAMVKLIENTPLITIHIMVKYALKVITVLKDPLQQQPVQLELTIPTKVPHL